jgi:CHAP domain
MRSRRAILVLAALCTGAVSPLLLGQTTAAAQPVAYGSVLVAGGDWAGAAAALGDVNVYSNGNGNQDTVTTYGLAYECVELAQRWAAVRFGEQPIWPVAYAYQMWNVAPHLKLPWQQLANGGAVAPQFGDLIVFGSTSTSPTGHVAVVAATGPGYVDIVEQNWGLSSPTGRARLPIAGTTMPARSGLPVLGWLRAAAAPVGLQGAGGPGGLVLDGYGGLHPWGSAAPVPQAVSWPRWDIARGVAVQTGAAGGYVLDGYGGVHPFGAAPPVTTSASWPGWDIARSIALRPDGVSGYVLDGWGGIHPFGGAPPVTRSVYWSGWDIARSIALRPDGRSGYVLDGWGGVHAFGGAPAIATTAYWPRWDIARGLALRSDGSSGWVVDGWNGLHAVGGAPAATSTGYFPGQDVARGIVTAGGGGGYTVTAWGLVRQFGAAPPVTVSASFANPVARGVG